MKLAAWSGAAAALEAPGEDAEVRVIWASPARMARLNRQFLGHEGATDVLSFRLAADTPRPPERGGRRLAGELYVCPAVASRAASCYTTTPERELVLYVLHGFLHLAGEEDGAPGPRRRMRRLERRILAQVDREFVLSRLFLCTPAGERGAGTETTRS